jgi:pyruvate dehydrogenase E2 component (dihydrolipoamide acetyltransferase)
MAEVINMPLLSDTMEEGVIAAWHKKVGDKVKNGDLLAEIETDKATMDFESPFEGVLLHIGVEEGEALAVGKLLAIIGKAGEDVSAHVSGNAAAAPAAKAEAGSADSTPAPVATQTATAAPVDINAEVIQMPLLSDTMEEGTIAAWHKKVGDEVDNGDLLAEIETDKATMDFESPFKGTLLHIGAAEGDAIQVGALLAIIGEKGTDISPLLNAPAIPAPVADAAPAEEASVSESASVSSGSSTSSPAPTPSTNGRIKASPLAKAMAKEKGIELSRVNGSGTDGRIVKRDIENYKESAVAAAPAATASVSMPTIAGTESFEEVKLSQMRKAIARRLGESKFQAPHFYLTMEIDMDDAIAARKQLNEVAPAKISFNDMVIKAVAAALRKHPDINASWMGDRIRYNHHIHIGMAVAVPEGLVVPVIRFADQKGLSAISADSKALAAKARDKKLSLEEMQGNTFTVSNLGMFGIEEFTAIINPPDACIMAIGGIKQVPVVKNGQIVPGNIMKVTLSCDHRVVDGAKGAAFLVTFKELMEEPVRILL